VVPGDRRPAALPIPHWVWPRSRFLFYKDKPEFALRGIHSHSIDLAIDFFGAVRAFISCQSVIGQWLRTIVLDNINQRRLTERIQRKSNSRTPCHYIVADRAGNSFIYENSTGRNVQHVIDGVGKPQVVTNFQIHRHPDSDVLPAGTLTIENNAFWRYATLAQRIAERHQPFTTEDLKANNACVNIQKLTATIGGGHAGKSVAADVQSRTLWHSLYDQHAKTVEFSFYLGEVVHADGTRTEHRSEYLKFTLAD
jgi:hypothetical protein